MTTNHRNLKRLAALTAAMMCALLVPASPVSSMPGSLSLAMAGPANPEEILDIAAGKTAPASMGDAVTECNSGGGSADAYAYWQPRATKVTFAGDWQDISNGDEWGHTFTSITGSATKVTAEAEAGGSADQCVY